MRPAAAHETVESAPPPIPMLADIGGKLSSDLGILNKEEAVSNRATFIIDPDGTINGEFTNGQVDKLAKVAVAQWYDPSGLSLVAPSVYETTAATGEPTIGKPEDLNTEI